MTKKLATKIEQRLIDTNFSFEEISSIFSIEDIILPNELQQNFKFIYFKLKDVTSCSEMTLSLIITFVTNYALKHKEERVNVEDFKIIKHALRDLKKLENQIRKKTIDFQSKYPYFNIELNTNLSIADICNIPKIELDTRVQRYSNLVNNIAKVIPPQRNIDDYYSNLFQVKVRNLIALNKVEIWPTFFAVINIFKQYYPLFLQNIENNLTIEDKNILRDRLRIFEKYNLDNNNLQLQKKLVKPGRKDLKK